MYHKGTRAEHVSCKVIGALGSVLLYSSLSLLFHYGSQAEEEVVTARASLLLWLAVRRYILVQSWFLLSFSL